MRRLLPPLTLLAAVLSCRGDEPARPRCLVHGQCPGGVCQAGFCVGATPCVDDSPCERRSHCVAGRCIPNCETDVDCPAGYVCTMEGCQEFSYRKAGVPPVDRTAARAPLRAGVAEVPLDVPVGVSLGGFASRGGRFDGPYAATIAPSTGFHHRLTVKALALDTGNERVVLVRAPLIFPTDFLRERVVRRVIDETGVNYRDHLILTATHTHSGPARIWTLPLGFGAFGLDEYMEEIHERIAQSLARALLGAVARLAPARMGWVLDEAFDLDDRVTSDRRLKSPPFDDHRLLLLRVDDAEGKALAAVLSFGIHLTIHEGPYLSNDAGAGIEMRTEEALEAREGRRVPVLFVNGNGGTMSPRCDDTGLWDVPRMELCGIRTVPYVLALWEGIARKDDWNLRLALKRIPISRRDIPYAENEFYDEHPLGGLSPYLYGAFQCLVFTPAEELPARDGQLGCVLGLESTFRAPVQVFGKTVLSALRLDDLVLVTQPGEPGMEYGAELVRQAKMVAGVREAVIWGYAQDHQLYFLHPEDWLLGGLEAQTSVWGYRLGEYLIRESRSLVSDLMAGRTPESNVMPQDFFVTGPSWVTPEPSAVAEVGTFIAAAPATVERLTQISFTFAGGHPGAGSPQVVLQREVSGVFVDLAADGTPHRSGRTLYDNATYKFLTDYRKEGGRHLWSVRWEELRDFPLGRYRFRIVAPYWDGARARVKEVFSSAFALLPSSRLQVLKARVSATGVWLQVLYPPGVVELVARERFERGLLVDQDCDGAPDYTLDVTQDYRPVGIRVRDPDVGPIDPIPARAALQVSVRLSGGVAQVFPSVAPGAAEPVTVPIPEGRGPVTASTRFPELLGRQADKIRCITLEAPSYSVSSGVAFAGPGSYEVQVEDAWGNHGTTTVVVR
jgi:hypothetical protein